jgi:hypothetical protein
VPAKVRSSSPQVLDGQDLRVVCPARSALVAPPAAKIPFVCVDFSEIHLESIMRTNDTGHRLSSDSDSAPNQEVSPRKVVMNETAWLRTGIGENPSERASILQLDSSWTHSEVMFIAKRVNRPGHLNYRHVRSVRKAWEQRPGEAAPGNARNLDRLRRYEDRSCPFSAVSANLLRRASERRQGACPSGTYTGLPALPQGLGEQRVDCEFG